MFRAFLMSALLTVPAASALGGDPNQPKGPPPRVMVLDVEREGTSYIRETRIEYVTQQRMQAVKMGNQVVQRAYFVQIPVMTERRVALDGKDTQVFGSDGKRIPPQDVPRYLKAVPVLVSADGKPVDPFYLRLVREGTLIVVSPALVPAAVAPIGPVPVTPPPPPLPQEKIPAPK